MNMLIFICIIFAYIHEYVYSVRIQIAKKTKMQNRTKQPANRQTNNGLSQLEINLHLQLVFFLLSEV